MTIDEVWLKERAGDLKASILFLTRLRYGPATPISGAAIAQAAWAFPIAGVRRRSHRRYRLLARASGRIAVLACRRARRRGDDGGHRLPA